ncbi:MAG: hypothetical protein KDE28_12895 [Anaerolineales bacterium]|nr:hypothetical protein [Anaerolineales bacterium]
MFMRRRAFFLAPLMFLLLLGGLLMMFSRGRSADAYEAGFVAGQMAASQAESPAPAPIAPSSVYGGPHTVTGFSFFGGLLKLFFFIFLFGWLFRMFGFWRWRHWQGAPCGPHHRGPWGHGHHSSEGPREKSPDDFDAKQHYV